MANNGVDRRSVIKSFIVISNMMTLFLFLPGMSHSLSSAYEATPAEQGDIKPINQVNQDPDNVYKETPIEQDDVKSINQVNEDSDRVYSAEPAERQDVTPADKLNN
jgi:hypothetical protein